MSFRWAASVDARRRCVAPVSSARCAPAPLPAPRRRASWRTHVLARGAGSNGRAGAVVEPYIAARWTGLRTRPCLRPTAAHRERERTRRNRSRPPCRSARPERTRRCRRRCRFPERHVRALQAAGTNPEKHSTPDQCAARLPLFADDVATEIADCSCHLPDWHLEPESAHRRNAQLCPALPTRGDSGSQQLRLGSSLAWDISPVVPLAQEKHHP